MGVDQTTIPLSRSELEDLIRRVVREEVGRLLHTVPRSVLDDWTQEGPEDLEGDRALLAEAAAVLEKHGGVPDAWLSWEDFERDLEEAESAGQPPH